MKTFELIKLGLNNLTSNKKRNFLTILVISLIFSLLTSFYLLTQGMQNLFINEENKIFKPIVTYTSICAGTSCKNPQELESIVKQKISKYNGKFIEISDSSLINKQYAQDFIKINSNEVQPEKTLLLASDSKVKELYKKQYSITDNMQTIERDKFEEYKKRLLGQLIPDDIYVYNFGTKTNDIIANQSQIVGFAKSFDQKFTIKKYEYSVDLWNALVPHGNSVDKSYYIDNNSIITNQIKQKSVPAAIVEFNSLNNAYNYYENEDCNHKEIAECSGYVVSELITSKIDKISHFNLKHKTFQIVKYPLIIAAALILIFSFLKIVNENSHIIALYRSLGASFKDVFVIYFSYLVSLALLTILISFILSLLINLGLSIYYQNDIKQLIAQSYQSNLNSFIYLIGFNKNIIELWIIILCLTPLSSLLTLDQLSMKNISKKLK